MRFDIGLDRCILCLEKPPDSWEHIIPDFIGGRLQARLTCKICNNDFGRKIIASLKSDMAIRYALEYLANQIPEIYEQAIRRQPFYSEAEDGSIISIVFDGAKRKLISHAGAKGSKILDTHHGERSFLKEVEKLNLSDAEKAEYSSLMGRAEDNISIRLPSGVSFIKRSVDGFQPQLNGYMVDDRLPALIAYEFLALMVGDQIYNPYMDAVREFLKGGLAPDYISVERRHGRKYEPNHQIYVQASEDDCRVILSLFHFIAFAVKFSRMSYETSDMVYIEDLKKRRTLVADTLEEAIAGSYYVL